MGILPPLTESPDNDAVRELRDEVVRLNKTLEKTIKSNEKFTRVLVALAVAQLAIAYLSFTADNAKDGMTGLIMILTAGAALIYIIWAFTKN